MSSSASAQIRQLSLPSKLGDKTASAFAIRQEPKDLSDEVLVELINGNDRDALAVLFRRYSASVYNVGRRILRDRSEADDLVQEVFLYVFRKSGLFDSSKGSARSWFFQVAYTQALLRRRKLQCVGFYASGIPDRGLECNHSEVPEGADYDRSVEGMFGRNGWKKIVEDLTEDQRETLRLHFFEGYTFAEIAERVGQSHRNIRNHYYRGLEKLREHLANNESNTR
jgi:RNA polymerase sigma-70 factor (ECF subfamily)